MGAILHRLMERDWITTVQLAALSTQEIQELGTFANRAAGINCTRYGGVPPPPHFEDNEQNWEQKWVSKKDCRVSHLSNTPLPAPWHSHDPHSSDQPRH